MTRALLVAAAVFLGLRPAPVSASPARLHRYALLIGVSDGGPSRPRLRYAGSDARAVGRVLETLGGVAPADAVFVSEASRAALEAGFAAIESRLRAASGTGARRELMIYYSGHSDEDGLLLGPDRYPYDALRARVQREPADLRVVILDSCASGAFTRHKGGIRRPPFLVDSSIDMRGHAFLTSTSADEQAQESDRIAASFFTYYLLSGLRGAADVNQDRRVTLQEAYQFASQETLARTERTQGGPQHAAYEFDLTGTGDMVVTDVRGTDSSLVLPPELSGRITVRERDGALIAELHKKPGSTLELGVDPGDYVIAMETAPQVLQAEVALAAGQRAAVRPAAFHPTGAREITVARGDAPAAGPPAVTSPAAAAPPPESSRPVKTILFPTAADGEVDVNGFSFGFIADRVRRLRGLQLSIGANLADQGYRGAQVAAGANLAGGYGRGVALAAGANVLYGDGSGAQLSGGANVVSGAFHGAQLAGGFNVAGELNGAQLAPVNLARTGHGAQIGVVNAVQSGGGVRLGVVNVAGANHGLQLGVVNVAAHDDGESLALLNLIGDGIHALTLYGTDVLAMNVGVKLGARHLYTNLGVGYQPGDDLAPGPPQFARGSSRWSFVAGLGWRWTLQRGLLDFIELEADSVQLQHGGKLSGDGPGVSSLRAQFGLRLAPNLSVLAGAGVNVAVGTDGRDADLALGPQGVERSGATTVRIYPGLLLGIQI
jgi:hypothetical protein